MFYWIIVTVAWIVFHLIFRIKVIGRENLPKDRGFVLCPNHITAIDPVFVATARFWGKRLLVMGKEELFNINPIITWMFLHVGVVPVQRGKGDTDVVESAIESVKSGRGLLIFPEGTRTKDGNLGRIKSGALVIASAANADIIPCRIIYKGGKARFLGRCTIVFGKAISKELLKLGTPRSALRLRECKALLTENLENLLNANKGYM